MLQLVKKKKKVFLLFFLAFMEMFLVFVFFFPHLLFFRFNVQSFVNILESIASDLHFHRDCVQCRAFDKGEKKETCSQECMHFNMTRVESRDKLPQPGQPDPLSHCKEKDVDDCWFYFTYSVNSNGEANVHVVETPGINMMLSFLPHLNSCTYIV